MTPWKFQLRMIDWVRYEISNGSSSVVLQSPTGSGKTVTAAQIIQNALEKGSRVLFLAHRRELIKQCSQKLELYGIEHGLIMAGHELEDWYSVQVASIDTLRARALKRDRIMMPRANIVVIDEAHRSLSNTYLQVISEYPEAVILGLTATPCRTDGRGLGHVYDALVCGPSIKWLIENKYLVPLRYYAPSEPDLKGLKVGNSGDYIGNQVAGRMDKPKLIGDVVEHWLRLSNDRQTIVFGSSVAHSIHLRDRFREAGILAEHIDADTPTEERDRILTDLAEKRIQVLCNCLVLTEGWDCPIAATCVLVRPTKSLGLYLQMIGRVMRVMEGKKDGLVIDHSGAVYEHGLAEDIEEWSLDSRRKLEKDKEEKEKEDKPPKLVTCEACFVVYERSPVCPKCGHQNAKHGKYVDTEDGTLVEIGKSKASKAWTREEEQQWYSMFLGYAVSKCYKGGWAAHKYRAKFGVWPRGLQAIERLPNKECLAYIKYLNIRAAKARKKEQNHGNQIRAQT